MNDLVKKRGRTSYIHIDKELLKKLYFEERLPFAIIAKKLGVGKRTVIHKFQLYGFKSRGLAEAIKISTRKTTRKGSRSNLFKTGTRLKTGYLQILCKDHPDADESGYVFVHRLLASFKIGRHIDSEEQVHHIDGDINNNRLENLQVLSRSEHMAIHMHEKHIRRQNERTS